MHAHIHVHTLIVYMYIVHVHVHVHIVGYFRCCKISWSCRPGLQKKFSWLLHVFSQQLNYPQKSQNSAPCKNFPLYGTRTRTHVCILQYTVHVPKEVCHVCVRGIDSTKSRENSHNRHSNHTNTTD